MLKEGVILGERYEIISRIGSGGMADVYKAKDHKLNRMVAVKVLKPEFREDKTFIRKFRTEAQARSRTVPSEYCKRVRCRGGPRRLLYRHGAGGGHYPEGLH